MKDKKVAYGQLQFVVLEAVGQPTVKEVTLEECEEIDRILRALLKGDVQ